MSEICSCLSENCNFLPHTFLPHDAVEKVFEYRPVFDGADAFNSIGLAVLGHVGVDIRVMCHQIRLRAAVGHCAELEGWRKAHRISQLSTRRKLK